MAERKTTGLVPPDDSPIDGFDVPINESREFWSEFHLEDGSILRVKPMVTSVVRIPGRFDTEGNPMYVIRGALVMSPAEVPEKFKAPKKP